MFKDPGNEAQASLDLNIEIDYEFVMEEKMKY